MQLPDTVEVQSGEDPNGSVIWLHGLGADGHDFEPIVPELRLPDDLALRFVFPHAPMRSVTVNAGMTMRAWYDIKSLDSEGRADIDGVQESAAMLEMLIAREIERGIDVEKIVIAGFSQGGAIAIHSALTTQHKIGGLMALSTYLAAPEATENVSARSDLPVFMAHGSFDPVLQLAWGRTSAERLTEIGYQVEWHEYPMAHAVCPAEIADISAWLKRVFS